MGEKRKARGVCAHFTSGALMLWEMMSTLREKATTKEGVFLLAKGEKARAGTAVEEKHSPVSCARFEGGALVLCRFFAHYC